MVALRGDLRPLRQPRAIPALPHRRATVYIDSRIVEKYRDQLAYIFTKIGLSFLHSQCQLALEIEALHKYTILVILYNLD